MAVVMALYGLKSSGSAQRKKIAEKLCDMDFVTKVDVADVYCRQAKRPNGEGYYELLLLFVDDVLFCYHNPQLIIDALSFMCDLKYVSVVPLKIYLSTEIKKYQVSSGKTHWSMSITQYCNAEIPDHKVGIYCNLIGPLAELSHSAFSCKKVLRYFGVRHKAERYNN